MKTISFYDYRLPIPSRELPTKFCRKSGIVNVYETVDNRKIPFTTFLPIPDLL